MSYVKNFISKVKEIAKEYCVLVNPSIADYSPYDNYLLFCKNNHLDKDNNKSIEKWILFHAKRHEKNTDKLDDYNIYGAPQNFLIYALQENIYRIIDKIYITDMKASKKDNIIQAFQKVFKGKILKISEVEEIVQYFYIKHYLREDSSFFDKRFGGVTSLTLTIKEFLEIKNNIVKQTCKELGITQKELADKFGITASAISQWDSEVPKTAQIALELMIENHQLKKDLKSIIEGQKTLNRLAVQNLDS